MRFYNPEFATLFLVVIGLIMLTLIEARTKKKKLAEFIHPKWWSRLIPKQSVVRQGTKKILLFLAISLIVLCIMRPQFGIKYDIIQRNGIDIMVAVDTSYSMTAEDVTPSRFKRAKQEITALLEEFTDNRIGIIAFSGNARILCPLTMDYSALQLFVNDLHIGMMSIPGTQLGTVIDQAKKGFGNNDKRSKALIIYTDGETFNTNIQAAIKTARASKIKVITVGIGSAKGEPLPIKGEDGDTNEYKRDKNNDVIFSKLDEKTLIKLANETGGAYVMSNNTKVATHALYKQLSLFEKKQIEDQIEKNHKDQYQIILLVAFCLLVFEYGIPSRNKKRTQWKRWEE